LIKLSSVAITNNKNVNFLPIIRVEADERLWAPTEYATPELSFTLMLEEPKS